MSSELPNELWTEVFGGVNELDLIQVATASRAFCALARPLLFAGFTLHPYAVGASGARFLPTQESFKSATERLNFWLSAEIAPIVHSCIIMPWLVEESEDNGDWVKTDLESACCLLDTFFENMERFTRMKCLRVANVDLPPLTPTKLASMTYLREVFILWTNREATTPQLTVSAPRSIPLTTFSFICTPHLPVTRDPSAYIPLLDPACLRQLSLFCLPQTARILSIFPCVTKVTLFLDFDSGDLVDLLSKFPNAEWVLLRVGTEPEVFSRTDERSFPCIKKLSIPVQLVPMMLALCPSVVLVCLRPCHAVRLLLALESIDTCPTLRALLLDITGAEPNYDFSQILAPFPGLTNLFIHLTRRHTNSTAAGQLFASLTPALPQTLSELAVCFSFTAVDISPPPSGESEPYSIRDGILTRCPQLDSMTLHAQDWFLSWQQSADVDSEPEEEFVDSTDEQSVNGDKLRLEKEAILSCYSRYR
ncbi:hypothetical protein C8F01DRAFT_1376588 [Mycena amicta]|nr:hypothetical protein C8F01DRAFT_1376588 [Mycena amicta]